MFSEISGTVTKNKQKMRFLTVLPKKPVTIFQKKGKKYQKILGSEFLKGIYCVCDIASSGF